MTDKKVKFVLSAEDRATQVMRRFKGQLAEVQGGAEKLTGALGLIGPGFFGAFSVAGAAAFVAATARGIDKLNDLADATGASVENLSALEDVAARTGTSFDTVGDSVVKFNKVLSEAKPGSATAKILEKLGLDAEELRRIDPAEALRQFSVALAQFSDDGDKARIVQALLGKGMREIAPFLKDLSTQTELLAKVTTAEARAAEQFNQQLSALSKNSTDAARSLTSKLLPSLNEVFDRVKAGRQTFGGFWEALLANAGEKQFTDAADGVEYYTKKLADLQRKRDALASQKDRRGLPDLDEEIAKAKKLEEFYRRIFAATAQDLGQTDPRELARRGRLNQLPGIGNIPEDDPKAPKEPKARRLYSDSKNEALTDALKAIEQTDVDKIRDLEARLSELFNLQRETRGDPAVVEAIRKTREEIDKLMMPDTTAILDPLEEQKQNFLRSEKAVYDDLKEEIKGLDEFAQQAGRNIQDALGDTLARTLRGDFSSIGRMWGDLIINMIAQAAAAKLNKYLFGDIFSGGNNTGAIGSLLTTFLPSFDRGIDYVPYDMVAKIHQGERVLTEEENRSGTWGRGVSIDASGAVFNITGPGVTMAEVAAGWRANNAMLEAKFTRMLQRRGVA